MWVEIKFNPFDIEQEPSVFVDMDEIPSKGELIKYMGHIHVVKSRLFEIDEENSQGRNVIIVNRVSSTTEINYDF